MSVLKRVRAIQGYVRYRVHSEVEYLRQFSGTFQYLERTYRWWRYNFTEYVNPSSLPNPPGTPPAPPPWTVAPYAALLRRLPVWEMWLDNVLLFGHATPTNAEVEFRRAYLRWAEDMKRGECRTLPLDDIVRDARAARVPLYEYPFVHEELWAFAAARVRNAAARVLPAVRPVPPGDLPPWPTHWRNFVMVRDEDGRWDVARPAQLLLPVDVAAQHGASGENDAAGTDASDHCEPATTGAVAVRPPSQHAQHRSDEEEMRAAAQDMRAAAADAWQIFGTARATLTALTPALLEFARDRVDTLRAALSEFMQGYAEGTQEVESGKVDVAGDAQEFYNRMLHTLPDTLASLDDRLQRPHAAPATGGGTQPHAPASVEAHAAAGAAPGGSAPAPPADGSGRDAAAAGGRPGGAPHGGAEPARSGPAAGGDAPGMRSTGSRAGVGTGERPEDAGRQHALGGAAVAPVGLQGHESGDGRGGEDVQQQGGTAAAVHGAGKGGSGSG